MTLIDAPYSEFPPASHPDGDSQARRGALRFRLKAFGFHAFASVTFLTLALGGLYLGWYRWPGWYLCGVSGVTIILMGVDLTVGPLLTFLIASSTKPARELARDIAVIAAVQLAALAYGVTTLWHGRPLYYVYAVNRIEMIQAAGIDSAERDLMRKETSALAPTWHSLPQWVSAPYVPSPHEFKAWSAGIPELRKHLKKVDAQLIFTKPRRESLKRQMEQRGLAVDQPDTIFLHGRGGGLLVVFDRSTMQPKAILAPSS